MNGLGRRNKASRWVKPAERIGSVAQVPRATGKWGLDPAERELIVDGGTRRPRANAGVGETGGDKALDGAVLHASG